jgi:5-(carboxyamino)imidazole ribonucleotide mutase
MIGLLAGNDADLALMREAKDLLAELGIDCELEAVGADHSPRRAVEYATTAERRGIAVIIAGSRAAPHLPGVVAGFTALPVIGVPVAASSAGGSEALLATAQMPEGVPVATVGVGAARNAALLAAEILGISDAALRQRVHAYKRELTSRVAFEEDDLISGSALAQRSNATP